MSEYRWECLRQVHPTARNRIIAGLSEAVVVVESDDTGGSLITARLGQDYDRRVFALSPSWCSDGMKGNARLLQEQVAELLHQPDDLARAMGWGDCREPDEATEEGGPLLSALDPYVARSFDDIVAAMDEMPLKALLEAELSDKYGRGRGSFTRTSR